MTFVADLRDLMQDDVLVAHRTAVNEYQEGTYAPDVSVKARVVHKNKIVRTPDGREVVSNTTIWLGEPTGVIPVDRITLPDGTKPLILSVELYPDEKGDRFEVVYT